jgi:short-subunit dehydrogenase
MPDLESGASQPRPLALVTGASSGIGLEFARQLAAQDHDLLLVARRAERLSTLAEGLSESHDVSVHILPLDLTETAALDRIESFLFDHALHVDFLVNNAGFGLVGRFSEMDRAEQLNLIELNVIALTDLTRRLLHAMIARRRGHVLNVASSASFQPAPMMGVYHASKAFVLFLTEALAEELRGTGVTATVLCPGPVGQTEFGDRVGTEKKVPGLWVVQVTAARVAKLGIRAARRGKVICVPGALMKLSSVVTPRLPRGLVRRAVLRIQNSRRVPDQ